MAGSAFKNAANVAKVKASFTPILLDGDNPENGDLARKYGIHYYPSVVFADAAGKSLVTLDGATEEAFADAVGKLAK